MCLAETNTDCAIIPNIKGVKDRVLKVIGSHSEISESAIILVLMQCGCRALKNYWVVCLRFSAVHVTLCSEGGQNDHYAG